LIREEGGREKKNEKNERKRKKNWRRKANRKVS
jgi:hypothetical protein